MSEQLKRSSSGTVRRLGMSVGALALVGGIFAVPASIVGSGAAGATQHAHHAGPAALAKPAVKTQAQKSAAKAAHKAAKVAHRTALNKAKAAAKSVRHGNASCKARPRTAGFPCVW